jgi:hypothetical protein
MKAKILESRQDLASFQEAYRKISGLTVSLEYLAFARVMGIYCGAELKAGYVINFSGPYRYEMYLTEEERKDCAVFQEPVRGNVIEITCVWADKATFCTKMLRTKVLLNILGTLFKFREREIIVSTFIPSLEKMFIRYFPEVVYAGTTTFFGPPKYHRILRGSVRTVLRAAFPEFLRRLRITFGNVLGLGAAPVLAPGRQPDPIRVRALTGAQGEELAARAPQAMRVQ